MITFIGDYPCKVDAKGRLVFPSAFKKQMNSAAQDKFVVKKDIFEKCLVLYPMSEWENQMQIVRNQINPYNREHNRFLREFSKGVVEVSLDSSNRLLIPKRLLEAAGVDKEVVLAGQDGKIEIWSKGLYDQIGGDEEGFASLAERILGGAINETDK